MSDEERAEYCYECTGYGDDFYFDDDGNMVFACDTCWVYQDEEDE